MPDAVYELLTTEVALAKLGVRGIAHEEAEQMLRNSHVLVRNAGGRIERPQATTRRLLIGRTDGGRGLTLVVEQTLEPTAWLVVTGWPSTFIERRLLRSTTR